MSDRTHAPAADRPAAARRALSWLMGSGGDGPGPQVRPLDVIMVVAGVASIVAGLVLTSSAQSSRAVPPSQQASITSVLQAAEQGQVESVAVPSVLPATAVLARDVTDGPLARELGGPLSKGQAVRFYAPPAVQAALMERLLRAKVPLFMGPASPAAGSQVRVGLPASSSAVYAGQQQQAATSLRAAAPAEPASETGSRWGLFLLLFGIALVLVGAVRMVSFRARRRAKADQEAPAVTTGSQVPTTTFADVAGAQEAIEQLQEMVEFLRDPDRFTALGARLPRGALMVGPPGTGKTLLARAVAGEAQVAFIAASGSDMVEKYVGVGARRVRDLFTQARKHGRAIVFIDEIDAVARRRSPADHGSGSSAEHDQTLVALLTEMDGFAQSQVIVLAATNRPDVLDPALLRPGRLDRRVEVPLPDRRGREAILRVHAREVALDPAADLAAVARRTPGFSGAQLEAVVNEAALEAVRRRLPRVPDECLDAAVAVVAMGRPRHSALVTDADRRVTAWHEAGHAVLALLLADADPPVAVSIVPRGQAGGVTWMSGSDEQFLSRSRAHARLVVALGGRAAERMLLDGEFTQGAAGDLQSATEIALAMATQYGMTRLGLASRVQHLGGTTTKEVTEVVEELLAGAHEHAVALLARHEALVRSVAEELLEHEDLSAHDLHRIAAGHGVVPASTSTPLPSTPVPVSTAVLANPASPVSPAAQARPLATSPAPSSRPLGRLRQAADALRSRRRVA